MIDFLLDYNIKKETIKKMEKKYNQELLYILNCNEYEIKNIIIYMKTINILCIDDILLEYTELFLKTYKEFIKNFDKYDTNKLSQAINKDYHVLEHIVNNN